VSTSPEIDVHEELSGAAIGRLHWLLGILITLITLFDGYDTFNPAYVIHYVAKPWGLSPSQAGLLVSSGLVGFLFGAIGHGTVADRLGRRGTLLAGLWIVNVFTLLTAMVANDFWSFCALRFATGLGLGVLLPLGTTFINELAPRRVSNAFSLWGVTLGWSLGGNIVMQYAIDYPGTLRSLTLQAASSPYGFGGTKDAEGTPNWPDFAGSGGGTANPEFVRLLAEGDRGNGQFSPRTTMDLLYFKPTFKPAPDREEMYLSSLLSTKVTPGNYPGDMTPSNNWPNVAPGTHGVNNTFSPRYLNQGNFASISHKPPVLWIHGADDQIVSDTSLLDFGFLGQLGAVPGWPGAEIYPPQPMKMQLRAVLEKYKANGGQYQEVVLADCGHSPHIEKQESVCKLVHDHILKHS